MKQSNVENSDKEYGFTKEHPSLTDKRKAAIKYLGERYCLHPRSTYKDNWLKA